MWDIFINKKEKECEGERSGELRNSKERKRKAELLSEKMKT